MKPKNLWLAFGILLVVFSAAQADRSASDEARDRAAYRASIAPWKEIQPALPSVPLEDNLLPLLVPPSAPGYRYFIDTASLSLAADRVTRYTVVVISPHGSKSGFFEGLRCTTNEIKTYAYLVSDGNIRWRTRIRWQDITAHSQGAYGYRRLLSKVYLCNGAASHPVAKINSALRRYYPGSAWNSELEKYR